MELGGVTDFVCATLRLLLYSAANCLGELVRLAQQLREASFFHSGILIKDWIQQPWPPLHPPQDQYWKPQGRSRRVAERGSRRSGNCPIQGGQPYDVASASVANRSAGDGAHRLALDAWEA